MGKRAEQPGGKPPSGTRTTGYGWMRPGFITMPVASNDNRIAPRALLRQPQFWIWTAGAGLLIAWLATRL